MMSPIMASISGKLSNKVPIIIFQVLLAGRRTHNNRAFYFMGLRGFLWVLIMGSQNIMGLDYGSNISVFMSWMIGRFECRQSSLFGTPAGSFEWEFVTVNLLKNSTRIASNKNIPSFFKNL